MSSVTIPLRNDLPLYNQQTDLDGQSYNLAFRWNARAEQWFMDISTGAGDIIAANIALVINFPIARRFRDERMPPGIFMAFDSSGQKEDAGQADLGARVLLLYTPVAEVPGMISAITGV